MNQKELKELIEFLIEKDIAEFELERGDVKVRIKRGAVVQGSATPGTRFIAVPAAATTADLASMASTAVTPPAVTPVTPQEAASASQDGLHLVRSPIVGTFYEAPSPGALPFVKVGDLVDVGQVLCIVEAMKLMNEIESDVAGEITKKLVNNGQPIEYGQELFAIRPRK